MTMEKKKMTTDELFKVLPSHIGRTKVLDPETGERLGYRSDDREGNDMGWFYLHNDGSRSANWCASYGIRGEFVCLNPEGPAPYNNACAYADTPEEALQGLYDWCVKNGYIDECCD